MAKLTVEGFGTVDVEDGKLITSIEIELPNGHN